MRIRQTRRALEDTVQIVDYLVGENPEAARNVKRALDATIELIGSFPHCGRLAGEASVRVLPAGRYPYLVYWSVESDEVVILHIRDGRRRPWRRG